MSLFILPIIIWWTYYLWRLYNHAHDEQFLQMPWVYLWWAAYNTGWCYTLSHYFVLERLETQIFPFTSFPLANLICVSLYFLQLLSYLWIVKRQLTKLLSLTFVILSMMYVLVLVVHASQLPYATLYRYGFILIFISSSIAGLTLITILRKNIRYPTSHIAFAHLFWLTIFWLLSAVGLALIAVNAFIGLSNNDMAVETPLQGVGYICNMIAMGTMMIVTGQDTVLYRSIYPYRLWQHYKIRKLKGFILTHIEIEPITALSQAVKTTSLEIAIHETLITILDYYPYLQDNDDLRQRIGKIEATSQDPEAMLFKLTRLKLPTG